MANPTFDGTFQDFRVAVIRGNDYALPFAVLLPDDGATPPYLAETNAAVVDLTNWEAFWCTGKLRRDLEGTDDTTALFQVTKAGGGISITNATGGLGEVLLAGSLTARLPPGQTVFVDVKGKDAGGLEHTLSTGVLLVRSGVTMSG